MNIELFQWLVIAFIGIYSGLYWFNAAKCILSLREENKKLEERVSILEKALDL
ncbi:MAG: hypothetical protein HDR00_09300 [Lachnospiraceae bacterium]|nr:hypothetical protein [Lachnospiraceae bacterium]